MNHFLDTSYDHDGNPHHGTLLRLLHDEAGSIIPCQKDREQIVKNAKKASMTEEEYQVLLKEVCFATPERRITLLEQCI